MTAYLKWFSLANPILNGARSITPLGKSINLKYFYSPEYGEVVLNGMPNPPEWHVTTNVKEDTLRGVIYKLLASVCAPPSEKKTFLDC